MQNSCVRETSGLHESNVPYRLFVVPALIPLSSHFLCRLSCLGTSSFFTAFALPYLSFLCIRLLTHALYFPCVPFIPVPLPLCRPFCPSYSPSLGFPFPLMRVFSLVAPTFPVLFPFFPSPFPPLPPSFPRFPSPALRSFLSFVFHLEKSFPLNRA